MDSLAKDAEAEFRSRFGDVDLEPTKREADIDHATSSEGEEKEEQKKEQEGEADIGHALDALARAADTADAAEAAARAEATADTEDSSADDGSGASKDKEDADDGSGASKDEDAEEEKRKIPPWRRAGAFDEETLNKRPTSPEATRKAKVLKPKPKPPWKTGSFYGRPRPPREPLRQPLRKLPPPPPPPATRPRSRSPQYEREDERDEDAEEPPATRPRSLSPQYEWEDERDEAVDEHGWYNRHNVGDETDDSPLPVVSRPIGLGPPAPVACAPPIGASPPGPPGPPPMPRRRARGGNNNPNVRWHTERARAQREGRLQEFYDTVPKPVARGDALGAHARRDEWGNYYTQHL